MNTKETPSAATEGILFVCSTSHMDWDWNGTFEDYYNPGADGNPPVRNTLRQAFSLINEGNYQYNLCEVAWLQRYLKDNPGFQTDIQSYGGDFSFLGGGILSPDNLVCNGEVFIRNYLVGQQYIESIGLTDQITNVCWIPDDFGQDPELPVVLQAMGMIGTAFWRVPGDEPGNSPFTPTNGTTSVYQNLLNEGVAFQWKASDGSNIPALLLADGYGNSIDPSTATSQKLNDFVTGVYDKEGTPTWPTSNLFVPAGGDFAAPSSCLTLAIKNYNEVYATNNGVQAQLGTFQDYLKTLPPLSSQPLNPSNFWTGYFASRPQLKINQNKAVRYLMAAETACSILYGCSKYSTASLDGIQRLIAAAWNSLIPSAHHDFVTGTSPDVTYYSEQLPLSELALETSRKALRSCLKKMSEGIAVNLKESGSNEESLMIYNDLGFDRTIGTLVEIRQPKADLNSVQLGSDNLPIQKNADGSVLFQCPGLPSMSYTTTYLSSSSPTPPSAKVVVEKTSEGFKMTNDQLTLTISNASEDKWSLSNFSTAVDPEVNLIQSREVSGKIITRANEIQVYNDSGNLYQFGNEPGAGGTFSINSEVELVTASGSFVEEGPLRAVFEGEIHCKLDSKIYTYTVRYTLIAGEPLVRISFHGSTPNATVYSGRGYSVITQFPLQDASQEAPTGMNYGTANHWHKMDYVPYWEGPTFRATHDYMVLTNSNTDSMAAIYHHGTPAWALDDGTLLGTLLRNAPGTQRGAAGTDNDEHTQHYALRLPGVGSPDTCAPLKESLSIQNAPFKKRVSLESAPSSNIVDFGLSNQLASLDTTTSAMIRVARTQDNSGSAGVDTESKIPLSLLFRIYQPTNITRGSYSLELPFASNLVINEVESVTALEKPAENSGDVSTDGNTVKIDDMPTLATLRIQLNRPYLPSTNGK